MLVNYYLNELILLIYKIIIIYMIMKQKFLDRFDKISKKYKHVDAIFVIKHFSVYYFEWGLN